MLPLRHPVLLQLPAPAPEAIEGIERLIVSFVNTVTLIVPVFFTGKVLNKSFDKEGKRKAE